MHPFNLNEIDAGTGEELIKSVTERGRFDELRLLLIQQSDLEDLIGILRESLKETA
jgi:hypothetical protein